MDRTTITPQIFRQLVQNTLQEPAPVFSDDRPDEFHLEPGDVLIARIGNNWNLILREDGTVIPIANNPDTQLSLGNMVIATVADLRNFLNEDFRFM